jgi:cell growth-regulating nucleolar protein
MDLEQLWDLISKALEELRLSKVAAPNIKNNVKASEETGKTSAEENGIKRKNDIENEIPVNENKKRRKEAVVSQKDESCKPANDTINSDERAEQSAKVKWCTIGKIILRAQDDKELSLKKFQKKIIGEYLHRMGDALSANESVEVLWSKCQKKLSKNPKFKILKDKIKLVS